MNNETRLKDLRRIREDFRVEYMAEIRIITNKILEKAKEANDTQAISLIEKYVLPVVDEHLQAAKKNQALQPTF